MNPRPRLIVTLPARTVTDARAQAEVRVQANPRLRINQGAVRTESSTPRIRATK